MNILFSGPERVLDTNGHGKLKLGESRTLDPNYAYDLITSGRVQPADAPSWEEYAALREKRLAAAAAVNGLAVCDRCHNEVPAKLLLGTGCPYCPKPTPEQKEN